MENELNVLQKKTRVRNITMVDIKSAIKVAEEAMKSVRVELRTSVELEYTPHSVAGAYSWRAEGTSLTVKFNKRGRALAASVFRSSVTTEVFRIVLNTDKLDTFIQDVLFVSKPQYGTKERIGYDKLSLIVAKESGFNQHYTRLL